MRWDERRRTRKGDYGEALVIAELEKLGWTIYGATTAGAHPFDYLMVGHRFFLLEVKAKARRNLFADTGLDLKYLAGYRAAVAKTGFPMYLFFVDEMEGRIYGERLDRLMTGPYVVEGALVYWPLDRMKTLRGLSESECEKLRELSSRSYGYAL